MKTLRDQLPTVSDFEGFERESNQEATIIDRKMATNGSGTEFILVEFFSSNGHPFDAKGLTVVLVVENYIYDIDSQYVKSIFNR